MACNGKTGDEPRALPWAGMKQAVGLKPKPSTSQTHRVAGPGPVPIGLPIHMRCSWVRVPPVELGGSRRNGQVPVQPQGWRGLSSPGIEPTGRNEDEPHPMSLVMLKARRRRASGALREGRCSQETQSPCPANSVGVSVASTSVRSASDKRGGPGR